MPNVHIVYIIPAVMDVDDLFIYGKEYNNFDSIGIRLKIAEIEKWFSIWDWVNIFIYLNYPFSLLNGFLIMFRTERMTKKWSKLHLDIHFTGDWV